MKLSIVIPAYNEENTILTIIEKVKKAFALLPKEITATEIVVVEDASTDGTKKILSDKLLGGDGIKVHFQPQNCGKGAAIRKGFELTSGDIVIIQDADLEYDHNEYSTLIRPIIDNVADVVYGSRFKGVCARVLYFWHYVGNQLLTLLSNMFTNINLTDMETCYKVFRGDIIRNMILTSNRFGIEPEMTAKIAKLKGVRIYEVPISYYGRTYEEGKKIGWKDGVSALWCIIKFNVFTSYEESFKVKKEKLLKAST